MAKVTLKNVSPLGDLDLPLIGRQGDACLKAGEEFEIDEALAGRAPGVVVDDEGNEVADLGVGLLAQVGNFELVTKAAGKTSTRRRRAKSADASPTAADTTETPGEAAQGDDTPEV